MKKYFQTFASFMLVVFFIVLAVASSDDTESGKENKSGNSETSTSTKDEQSEEEKKKANWTNEETEDKMSGQKRFFTYTTSTNKIEFDFPYQGGSTFTLLVRNMGKGNDVALSVSKGQFMPSIMNERVVRVKFDDEQPSNYAYAGTDDGSSTTIFLVNARQFINKLKKAKKLMIEAPFYDAGMQIIYFDVEGFKWSK
ncbi:hypothetical protein BKI52_07425 [marine bacterium AO1-C]|nr:hypothetical protein BKI52_07425 [marine bacterium AO1-C]